jgi:predicted NUDIX family phosphoesterase
MKSNQKQTESFQIPHDEHVEQERQTYLRVAEIVLAKALSPLKAREIVERGIERGLFGDHVLSRTPEKSMQARLSMDILNQLGASKFARTSRGRFTLRSKLAESAKLTEEPPLHPVAEYVAERRVLRTPKEEVLCAAEKSFRDVLTFQGIDTDASPILAELLKRDCISYIPRSEAEVRNDAKQFVTYVLVQCGQRLLFFKRSYLSRAAEFLRGSRCIGFGGHVSAADPDILSLGDRGLATCALRELSEELHIPGTARYGPIDDDPKERTQISSALPRSPNRATIKLFRDAPLECLGVLNDDSSEVGRRHVAVIFRVWLPDWSVAKPLQKGDSSLKGLGWIDLTKDKLDISDFEYWSQLCLRKFYPSTVITRSGFRVLNNAGLANDRAIVIAGRIGSGKTETANYLSQKLGWPLLKTGMLLQQLLGAPSMSEIGRREFQKMAFDFIRTKNGPLRLAEVVATKVRETAAPRCVIDGVCHLATFEPLERILAESVGLVFIQTPPDVAYDMYRVREAANELEFSYRDFLEIYDAPVESEISSLGRKAQALVYNSFGIEAFRRTLDEVAKRFEEEPLNHPTSKPRGRERVKARYPSDAA